MRNIIKIGYCWDSQENFLTLFAHSFKDLENEVRKKTDQVAHAQNSATKFLQEELEAKSQVSDRLDYDVIYRSVVPNPLLYRGK